MKTHTYTTGNVRHVDDILPVGYVVVDVYTPTSSVTPWDYYGGKHQQEYRAVLKDANIECVLLENRLTIIRPVGTGPCGAVRFGDNMLPHTYLIAVKEKDAVAASTSILNHKAAINRWLMEGGPRPEILDHV